eukprot:TRINITY_DN16116_c0_g1_i1.p1 TRINITY_DN16116_c0_g1~~TRINITY_DN16116_c0_g1_i1.p1  ORF type:complete len:196 (+),score=13.35 TRINITY_DN16116_c0_g1_i1:40-588(+)
MLTHAGVTKLNKLRQVLASKGFSDLDLVREGTYGKGDPCVSLAILGYLLEEGYWEGCLALLEKYDWFVLGGTDFEFVTVLWRLLSVEGHRPAITVQQFFKPKYADAKITILSVIVDLLKAHSPQVRKPVGLDHPPRPSVTLPVPIPYPLQPPPTHHTVTRPVVEQRAAVFKPLPRGCGGTTA